MDDSYSKRGMPFHTYQRMFNNGKELSTLSRDFSTSFQRVLICPVGFQQEADIFDGFAELGVSGNSRRDFLATVDDS